MNKSLQEVNSSVDYSQKKTKGARILAFFGPAYLISVGYMDPGNWATDIAGGSQFGYSLLWILLLSNLIALLLQSLCARMGIVAQRDLAQASKEMYSKPVNFMLYILAEISIAACDLAEVLGMAIGLNLLFGIPIIWGVSIAVFDTIILLYLQRFGIRKLELLIIGLISIIGLSFFVQLFLAQPNLIEAGKGLVPSKLDNGKLFIAIGIIGATVMPHNLYLHSALIQTRKITRNTFSIKKALKLSVIDSGIALNIAFFINASIVMLAASVFFENKLYGVADIGDAHKLLEPLLGSNLAPKLFAVALIAAGQSSTITGTLAGQIIMEGHLNIRLPLWIRRIITRLIAVIPAFFVVYFLGNDSTGELLILSQVILSLQLGFAIIPLIHFVSNKIKMGEFAISLPIKIFAWLSTLVIVSLNVLMVYDEITSFMKDLPTFLSILIILLALFIAGLLIYVTLKPLLSSYLKQKMAHAPHGSAMIFSLDEVSAFKYKHIAITLDFTNADLKAIKHALQLGGIDTQYTLIHIVSTTSAIVFGEGDTIEAQEDKETIEAYKKQLSDYGFSCNAIIGYGKPQKSIVELVNKSNFDCLVMASHGHTGLLDLFYGHTINYVRDHINIPLLAVK
jgi:manganese transport protein